MIAILLGLTPIAGGGPSDPAASVSNILLENGDDMLLEDGSFILTES